MIRISMFFFASVVATGIYAQGCSDAGVCTAGSLKQQSNEADSGRHRISLTVANGWGDDDVFVCTPALQYSFKPAWSLELQAKVTAGYASGPLGSVAGSGDLLIDAVKTFAGGKKFSYAFVAGVKIPLNASDLKKGSSPLPMQYQSSLGTFDIIIGATFICSGLVVSLGYQQPLSTSNSNAFTASAWANHVADAYPESNKFRRSADVVFKTGYNLSIFKRWEFTPGLLAIYHTAKDSYYDAATMQRLSLNGSDGATINITGGIVYNTAKWSAGIVAGMPIVARKVRPDGLTRSLVFLPEISYKF